MPASDKFERLGAQIDQAVAEVKASASQDKAKLQAQVDAARKKADEQSSQLGSRTREASQRAESRWQQVQGDWDGHVQRIRQHMDEKKAELDRKDAEREADWAEADAEDAVDFAAAAIRPSRPTQRRVAPRWPGRAGPGHRPCAPLEPDRGHHHRLGGLDGVRVGRVQSTVPRSHCYRAASSRTVDQAHSSAQAARGLGDLDGQDVPAATGQPTVGLSRHSPAVHVPNRVPNSANLTPPSRI